VTDGRVSPAKKRSRASDDDELEDDDNSSKRAKVGDVDGEKRSLASPFWKYDKERYSEQNFHEKHYRRCASTYTFDIPRLKQHLYRVHKRPEHYCSRCFESFGSRALLDQHSRDPQPCDVIDCPFDEKMTQEQKTDIQKRRGPTKDQSKIWFFIYETLFPNADKPSSPYVETVSPQAIKHFENWSTDKQACTIIRNNFTARIAGRFPDPLDQIFLDIILEQCLSELVYQRGPDFHVVPARGMDLPSSAINNRQNCAEPTDPWSIPQHVEYSGSPNLLATFTTQDSAQRVAVTENSTMEIDASTYHNLNQGIASMDDIDYLLQPNLDDFHFGGDREMRQPQQRLTPYETGS